MRTRPLDAFATLFITGTLQKICRANNLDGCQGSDKAGRMPPAERAWAAECASIDDVERRLADKYAGFSAEYVAAVVQHVYTRFHWSPVRSFIPLLVERRAAEELSLLRPDLAPVAFADLRVTSRETVAV
jgi:hypothetical protein